MINEFETLTDAELAKKLEDLKAELFNLRFSQASGSLANPISIRDCKRNIARVNTVMSQRRLGLSKAPVAAEKPAKKVAAKTETATKTTAKKEAAPKAAPKKEKAEKILV